MSHPAHPKCPDCGKALFKAAEKGKKVRKSDPFKFCRNPKCAVQSLNGNTNASPNGPDGPPKASPKAAPREADKRRLLRRKRPGTKPPSKEVHEPERILSVRKHVRDIVKGMMGGESLGNALFLAIMCQESGEPEAAKQLIQKYDLAKKFGLKEYSGAIW